MRDKMRDFFLEHPGKQYTFQEILKRFGTSSNNISCHLKALRDDPLHKWLLNPRKGLWELNPKHLTDAMIRLQAEEAGKKRVFQGTGFQHGSDTLTPTIMDTKYWRNHLLSIAERMRKLEVFTSYDIQCLEELMATKWPPTQKESPAAK